MAATWNNGRAEQPQDPTRRGWVSISAVEKIDALTMLVEKLVAGKGHACFSDGEMFRQQQERYDPYAQTYVRPTIQYGHIGQPHVRQLRRDEFDLRYGHIGQSPVRQQAEPNSFRQEQGENSSLRDLIKSLAQSDLSFQKETRAAITQLTEDIRKLEIHQGKRLAHMDMNPNENLCAMTNRNEKEVHATQSNIEIQKKEKNVPMPKVDAQIEEKNIVGSSDLPRKEVHNEIKISQSLISSAFPCRLAQTKKKQEKKETVEVLKEMKVNKLLLDAVKQVPRCSNFLTDLCIKKISAYSKGTVENALLQMDEFVYPLYNPV